MLKQSAQVDALTTGRHIRCRRTGKGLLAAFGKLTTFNLAFPLPEDFRGNGSLASLSASVNVDAEVCTPDREKRRLARRDEFEGHGSASYGLLMSASVKSLVRPASR